MMIIIVSCVDKTIILHEFFDFFKICSFSHTANTMKLEDQANSKNRIETAIRERAAAIKNERPKILWD